MLRCLLLVSRSGCIQRRTPGPVLLGHFVVSTFASIAGESLERRRRLIEQENARRRAEGLATIAAPAGPESDAERRARLIRQQQEYAASVGAAPAPAPTSAAPGSGWAVDWQAVRQDLLDLMNSDLTYDDGTYAPLFIRLAWHSSGTYQARDNSGGSSGAGMRFPDGHEIRDPENAGLDLAMHFLEPIKNKYPGLSYSDLWILAALVGIEKTGGPNIEFRLGRKDSAHPSEAPANGRLPGAEYGTREGLDAEGRVNGWENLAQHVRDVFYRMGFNDREIVALLCGGHVYGRCHYERSGYMGPWVAEPWKFSNEYAADMIDDEWICVGNDTLVDGKPIDQRVRPAPGRRQYVSKMTGSHAPDSSPTKNEIPQMMLVSDMVLLWDANFKQHLEVFAEDEEALKVEFGAAYKKLTELGVGSMDVCPYAKMAAAY